MYHKIKKENIILKNYNINMGYFAKIDIKIDVQKEMLVKFIIENIWKKNVIKSSGKLEKQGYEGIFFESMAIFIDMSDDEDFEYFAEQYGMDLNYRMYIELYQKSQDRYVAVTEFLIKMLETYSGDCIFSINGSTLLIRRSGNIIIDKTIKKKYNNLPYKNLPGIYVEGDIDD